MILLSTYISILRKLKNFNKKTYRKRDTNTPILTPKRRKQRHADNRKTQIKPEFLQKKNLNRTLSYSI